MGILEKLEEVFKRNRLDYDTIKEICARKRIALWLLDNRIEAFNQHILNEDVAAMKEFLLGIVKTDTLLALKLIYKLNNYRMKNLWKGDKLW